MRRSLPSLIVIGLASPALAGASILPLSAGTYVMADTPCKDAAFAAMMSWDGKGLGDPHSHGCRATVVARAGKRFTIANSCIDAGVGPAPRSTERVTLTVLSRDSYAIDKTRYRRCPNGTD